ncbi:MAG TPA: DUF5916 domain-containing protein [Longimicrobiaceae bacterium]|nr:DUF5916 domain-containing protein [Longimicrobiaceae bacterium]
MNKTGWIMLAAIIAGSPSWSAAQGAAQLTLQSPARPDTVSGDAPTAKRIEAVATSPAPPRLDGKLDDSAWQTARWISDFVQREPDQGAPSTLKTEVAFLFDGQALFVGARMHGDGEGQLQAPLTRRDDAGNTERLVVSLDTYRDRRTAYAFAVTAAGVRLDWYHPDDNTSVRDNTFNPVWEARVGRDSLGWTVEMRIPFSQLRFNTRPEQVWGVNVSRILPDRNEEDHWVLVRRDQAGWASRFGEMVGIQLRPSRRVEVVPYLASEARFASRGLVDPADPFRDGREGVARVGADLKLGLGPNLTLDATVNPDFGQVDADPAEVNLTAFETLFEERRPFFTEGRQMLIGVGPQYLYSRRIGAAPHRRASGDFTRAPETTTILGAAKLTGRLPSGLSVGALGALTSAEEAETFDRATGRFGSTGVEPLTGYGVLRLQQEFGPNASTVGATLTGVRRDLDGNLAALLPQRAFTGGVDWNRRFQGGVYELMGHLGFSRVEGDDTAAIARLQRSSARYFLRPDQDHVRFDPTRTSLSGWTASLRGGKRSGRWLWGTFVWAESPGFELNDLGRLGDTDNIFTGGGVTYNRSDPGPLARQWQLRAYTNHQLNFGGVRTRSEVAVLANATWKNFWHTPTGFGVLPRAQSDHLTRGGPLMQTPLTWWWDAGVIGNPARKTRWETYLSIGGDELGSWRYQLRGVIRTQVGDRLTLALEPRVARRADARQYLAERDGGGPATFGRRYLFGRIDRTELAAPLRAGYSFTPDLSLDVYAEPFAASGRYSGIGELAAARTFHLRRYGAGGSSLTRDEEGNYTVTDGDRSFTLRNPDFDRLSFRSNAVMRWEWRPGSTLFLVWQQNRSASDAEGRPVGAGDLLDAIGTEGENVLALKLSYWLPVR